MGYNGIQWDTMGYNGVINTFRLLKIANWKMDENGPFLVDLPMKHGDFPQLG